MLPLVAGLFVAASAHRLATIWHELPPHLETLREPEGSRSLLRSVLKYLGPVSVFWAGATLILAGAAVAPAGSTTLEGPARLLVVLGLVVVMLSLLLLVTIGIWGRPRALVPPTLRE